MSFRLSQPKFINIATPPSIGSNIDIPGYYQQNGVPINNQFYPALSTATSVKAIDVLTDSSSTTQTSWNAITWSPELGLFAMVRQSVSGNRIATSPDGIVWSNYQNTNRSYQGIVWCSDLSGVGMFVATVGNLPSGQEVTISTNGTTWTDVSTPTFALGAVTYSPELRRVVATAINGWVYSDDGYTWTKVSPPAGQDVNVYYNITWSGQLGLFACTSTNVTNRPISVSPDGINWSYYDSSPYTIITSFNTGIAWSPELGIFCAVESPGSNVQSGKILISNDGIKWTSYTSSSVGVPSRNLCWSSQLRMFLGANGNSIYYSYNGINWFRRNIGFNGGKSSCWNPELGIFLIAGDAFTVKRSFNAGRPPTSFNVFDSSLNNINERGLWNFQSFGRGIPVLKTTDFTIQPGENWIDVSNSTVTDVTLPTASLWPGREIMLKTLQNQAVNSVSANIFPLAGGSLTSNILINTAGKFATLVSDGSNWQIRQAN